MHTNFTPHHHPRYSPSTLLAITITEFTIAIAIAIATSIPPSLSSIFILTPTYTYTYSASTSRPPLLLNGNCILPSSSRHHPPTSTINHCSSSFSLFSRLKLRSRDQERFTSLESNIHLSISSELTLSVVCVGMKASAID